MRSPEEKKAVHDVMVDIIRAAQVVCSTAIGAGMGKLADHVFSRVHRDRSAVAYSLALQN